MPMATGWSYAPTGNGGQECPPSVNSWPGEAGFLSASRRTLRESISYTVGRRGQAWILREVYQTSASVLVLLAKESVSTPNFWSMVT